MRAAYGAAVVVPKPFAVVAGGIAGAAGRWLVFSLIDRPTIALFIVNSVGCIVLGAVALSAGRDRGEHSLWLGVGFCGAFTTFSTFSVAIAERMDDGHWLSAGGVLTSGLALGIGAMFVGRLIGRATAGIRTK
jgi:CrcB protein